MPNGFFRETARYYDPGEIFASLNWRALSTRIAANPKTSTKELWHASWQRIYSKAAA